MKKQVGIVTVYNACNYGSFLQAFALKKVIEEIGYNTDFVEIPVDIRKITCQDFLSEKESDYEKLKYNRLIENQKVFSTISSDEKEFNCCVIGSDTIWNMFDSTYQNIPFFVGKGLKSERIISYAASVGQSKMAKILLMNYFKLLPIRKLSAISVRDDNTEKIVKFFGKKCKRVIDPTFLYDFLEQKPKERLPENYLLVYTYGFSQEKVAEIKKYAYDNNLQIVATGSLCEWADFNYAVDSFEWLWLVKNAKEVITSTFHGTVFSIKYNKNFAVITDSSAKVSSLLNEFGLQNRICNGVGLADIMNTLIDYNEVNIIRDKLICESKEWLFSNLEK